MTAPHTQRFAYLDGLRGVAIFAVVAGHWGSQYTSIGRGGYIGVDIFFVLSGFVITTVIWHQRGADSLRTRWASFMVRRLKRLYPALLGLVVLAPVLCALFPESPFTPQEVVHRAALSAVQGTWVLEIQGQSVDPFRQTWSLAIEWMFYLLWPIFVYAARDRDLCAARVARWAVAAAAVLYAGSAALLEGRAFYFAPVPRFGEMLVGAALALWFIEHPGTAARRDWVDIAGVAGLGSLVLWVLFANGPFSWQASLVGIPLAVAVTLGVVWHGYRSTPGILHRLLSSGPVSLVGRVSYSLYLWHWMPIYLLDKDALPLPMPVLAAIGVLGAAGLTALSYVLLERPFTHSRGDALAPRASAEARSLEGSTG